MSGHSTIRGIATTTAVAPAAGAASRRRLYVVAAALLFTIGPLASLVVLDVALHSRFQKTGGVNVWGYRGPIVGRKRAGEHRIVMLGGSSAFGYGVSSEQAIPAQLQAMLARSEGDRFSVVNLGYNNEGAYSLRFTLADYLYLDYDLAILYEGYNDLMGSQAPNFSVFRHDSPIFRLTGYLPILPVVFREKAAALVHGGSITTMYDERRSGAKVVFDATPFERAAAGALRSTAAVGEAIERQLGRMSPEAPAATASAAASGCGDPWAEYCGSILTAVRFALDRGKRVLVVTQPWLVGIAGVRHQQQQRAMTTAVRARYGGDPRVALFDAGPTVDLSEPSLSFDRMHLTAPGNQRVAAALAPAVLALIASE